MAYHFNGPQLEFVGANLESVVFGGNQVFNIGGGVHGVRESPNGLYTNDTMQYLLGLGQGEPVWALRQRRQVPLSIVFGMRRGPCHWPKGFVV